MNDSIPPPKKVLIIDDEPAIVAYLAAVLEDNGYATCSTTDPLQGVELACEEAPDVICLDIMMPNQSGLALYRTMKLHPGTRAVPVIFVSAFSREKDLRLGFFRKYFPDERIPKPAAYVEKPINIRGFLEIVASVIDREKAPTEPKGENEGS